jgi:hypothetical protein
MSDKYLVLVAGLMGTGKTTLAQALSQRTGWRVISSDVVRKEIMKIPLHEHRFEKFDQGIYSSGHSRKVYEEMLRRARQALLGGYSVILDASFREREDRLNARDLASSLGAHFFLLKCVLPQDMVRERLTKRMKESENISDGRWEIFDEQQENFDPIEEEHITVSGAEEASKMVEEILPLLSGWSTT